MKTITVAGRAGKDGDLRHTQGGDAVLSFPLAVDDGYGDKKSTMWFDCTVWGKRAAALAPHISKGTALAASGDLGKREHEGKTYLTIRVNELTLQGGGAEKREPSRAADKRGYAEQSGRDRNPPPRGGDLDDEIPFAPEFR